MDPVLALGVDPGTLHLGWGVVSREGNRLRHVAHGVIHLDGKATIAARLARIELELGAVIEQHRPEVGSVENLFFHKDAQAASKLGHARGVVLLLLARAGVEIAEYPPARVKKTIAGSGQADKSQVAMMVRALLALDRLPPADAADALALAITHLRIGSLIEALRPKSASEQSKISAPGLRALLGKKRRSRAPALKPAKLSKIR
ncbi:MAG TPA: crossover junction endodeoxyribonuclease RuvC [Polyangiaceae bacterium]|nr:crossover junction endodeoxyribonuclease RuvC [Polyangiaceae bacterium]